MADKEIKDIRILLVDDEERFLSSARKVFRHQGIEILTADSGIMALKILQDNPVDAVILDVKMPGMNGMQTLEKIKTDHPDIQVILLTGHATTESAEEGMRYGASGYLVKPVDLGELLQKAKSACGLA
ncbi:MAG: response regulator [Desulfoplanes sp.]|jgi:DNA-binding NtrC family response regulator